MSAGCAGLELQFDLYRVSRNSVAQSRPLGMFSEKEEENSFH